MIMSSKQNFLQMIIRVSCVSHEPLVDFRFPQFQRKSWCNIIILTENNRKGLDWWRWGEENDVDDGEGGGKGKRGKEVNDATVIFLLIFRWLMRLIMIVFMINMWSSYSSLGWIEMNSDHDDSAVDGDDDCGPRIDCFLYHWHHWIMSCDDHQ